jgi:hypothetical protein
VTVHTFRGVSGGVKALPACVVVVVAASLTAGIEPARACSCALPDPRETLARGDGAFVGTLVSRRQVDQHAVLVFSVEKTLKGSIGGTVEVSTASNGAACGLEAPVGTRVGLVLERRGGAWHGYLCWQFAPEELLAAALPLPPPNGRGPLALVVGGEFGDVRLMALDVRGRTLAYGRGGGRAALVSVCPGKLRLAELAYTGSGTTVAIRNTRTLRVLRRHALSLPGQRYAQRFACEDRSGSSVVIFAHGPSGDSPAKGALYRVRSGRPVALWQGAAYDAGMSSSKAFLSAGTSGKALLRVDLATGRVARVATLPGATTGLALARSGTRLAGIQARVDRSSQVVRVDLRSTSARVVNARLAANEGQAQVIWLSGRLLFVPAYGPTARVLDDSLRTRSRFRWTAANAALVGSQVFGTDISVALFRAELPAGPMRTVRRLPGRPTLIVSATN